MEIHERETPWLQRVEDLIEALNGSTIGELELTEAGTEIVIRRRPDMQMVAVPLQTAGSAGADASAGAPAVSREERGVPVLAPLTGVYYGSPSPTEPPFVAVGDVVQAGQIVALVEAMKVFNEIATEVSGRVQALVATNGDVVQKGDVLLRVDPL